jgi:hypothetical protein
VVRQSVLQVTAWPPVSFKRRRKQLDINLTVTGTQECNSYSFKLDDRTIQLIDTPGFDDTSRTDDQVLRQLAAWLSFAYQQGYRLNGMVYLQTIGEPRMKGSHLTNLRMFQEMTGLEHMDSVVLTTTMWDKTDREDAKKRELQLMQEDTFWQPMIKRKSHVKRFMNDRESALDIIRILVEKHKMIPKLQHEMNVEGKNLDQTNAGKAVNKRLIEQKEKHELEKEDLRQQMEKALQANDMKYTQDLLDAQEKNTSQMKELEHAQEELKVSNERLLKEKEEQIAKAKEEMERLRVIAEQQGKDHAVEIEKRDEKERQMRNAMLQQAKETEEYREQVVDGAVNFIGQLNGVYKDILEEQEAKNKAALAKIKDASRGPPPPYFDQQQRPPPPPQPASVYQQPMPVYQQPMPVYQQPVQVVYPQQYQQNYQAEAAGAVGGAAIGGSLLALAATGGMGCTMM